MEADLLAIVTGYGINNIAMYMSMSVLDLKGDWAIACIPKSEPNYTGLASFHEIKSGAIRGDRRKLEGACLFPLSMVKEAIAASEVNWRLEGGDWVVVRLEDEAGNFIEGQSEYYSFSFEGIK